jgi:hypothetical protein
MFPSFLAWVSSTAFVVRLLVALFLLSVLVAGGCAARRLGALAVNHEGGANSASSLLVYPLVAAPALQVLLAR